MTLLIRNVQILGSDQKLPDRLDVFVSGEKIAAIGRFPDKKADEIVEGADCYLAPGFIDIDTESDHYLSLFTKPDQADFLKQGVTTIVGGLCGASLAPLIYGSLESIEDWTDTSQANVDWHSMEEFLKVLERRRLGVNFATLVGHTTIRQAILGNGAPRDLTKNELTVFNKVLEQSIKDGAFGFSTALSYVQNRATPYSEIKSLVTTVAKNGRVYATHLRNDNKDLLASVNETVKVATETGARTFVSHMQPTQGYEHEYDQALESFEKLPESLDLSFSLYPSKVRILKLYTFLPSWAQKDDLKVMNMSLRDSWLRQKIAKDLPKIDPKEFVVAQAPGNNSLVGYSLLDLKKLYSLKTIEETLLKLMVTTNLQGIIFYANANEYLIKRAVQSTRSLIASNAASIVEDAKVKVLKPERATSTFTKFLDWVLNDKIMPLDEAIRKITLEPARKLGLKNRGLIKDGYFADLVGLKGNRVIFTIVNGRVAVRNGELSGVLNGHVLRH